jgi:2-dehydro-3-deoxygluconokinase
MSEVVCVGESMALVTPDPPAPLRLGGPMRLEVAGAESTVACYLAQLGLRAAWASRVGADPLGDLLLSTIGSWGVDTGFVEVDPGAPTGTFFKDPGSKGPGEPGRSDGRRHAGTRVYYYRAGSAASLLGPESQVPRAVLTHLSGVTPALSSSCAALIDRLLAERRCSFDVNYRPGLWPVDGAAPVLHELAARAEIVFVGLDEARTLWGVSTAADVRALLPQPTVLVVKDGAVGATSFHPGGTDFVPTPPVDVVEPVGAGDAFAAGYLAGLLRGLPETDRLALGHRVAAAALAVTGDVAMLGPTVRSALSTAVGAAVGLASDTALGGALGPPVGSVLSPAVGSSPGSAADSAFGPVVGSVVGQAADSAPGPVVGSVVGQAADSALGQVVGSVLRRPLSPRPPLRLAPGSVPRSTASLREAPSHDVR